MLGVMPHHVQTMRHSSPFGTVALQAYLSEIRDLASSVLYRLRQLDAASGRWEAARADADSALGVRAREYRREEHADALSRLTSEHREVFDELEALLAAWARLSLLLNPQKGKGEAGVFALARGHVLRAVLAVSEQSPLLDRDLRNSWMHFDERLDTVIRSTGRWGNRHRFIHSSDHASDQGSSIRLIEVDTLRVTYPDEKGDRKTAKLRDLEPVLLGLVNELTNASERFRMLFPDAHDADGDFDAA